MELKFRTWDKEHLFMRSWENLLNIIYNERWFKDNQDKNYISCLFNDSDHELEQYTGMKDINGKEIYVNDTIIGVLKNKSVKGVVIFTDCAFKLSFHSNNSLNTCYLSKLLHPKIIGNIHE